MNLRIGGRLIIGFAAMGIILSLAVGITIWKVADIDSTATRIVELRMPTAASSSDMVKNIYASLAALRGYMLTGAETFKAQRSHVWADIDKTTAEMDRLSKSWTNPKNVENLQTFKSILAEFRIAQGKVEGIAKTPGEQPATLILVTKAAPEAAVMVSNISKIIDLELANSPIHDVESGKSRLQLLGTMADVRGTLGLGLANIRAYLLTGESKFATKFKKLWAKNEIRFSDLQKASHLLNPEQKKAFDIFSEKRKLFAPLPAKMFEIRGSKKWNMANYLLVSEAAPRAGKLMNMLLGEKNAEGLRHGGMQGNQQKLLKNDADHNSESVSALQMFEWVLLGFGLAIACVVTLLITRSIVGPINKMTTAMEELANGNVDIQIPAQDKTDEIGEMSKAVLVFKDNAIERVRLEAEQKIAEEERQERIAERAREQEERAAQREVDRKALMNDLADSFESSVGGVVQAVSSAATQMQATAQSMSAISVQTRDQSSAVAAAAEQADANVQTVASAAEELTASVNEINSQVTRSSNVAQGAVKQAKATKPYRDCSSRPGRSVKWLILSVTSPIRQTCWH